MVGLFRTTFIILTAASVSLSPAPVNAETDIDGWKKITVFFSQTQDNELGTCPDPHPLKMCSHLFDVNAKFTQCVFQLDLSRFNTDGIARRTFTCPQGTVHSDLVPAENSFPEQFIQLISPDFLNPGGPQYALIASLEPAVGTGAFAKVTKVLTRAKCELEADENEIITSMLASRGSFFMLIEAE